jgi:hypothetical protein
MGTWIPIHRGHPIHFKGDLAVSIKNVGRYKTRTPNAITDEFYNFVGTWIVALPVQLLVLKCLPLAFLTASSSRSTLSRCSHSTIKWNRGSASFENSVMLVPGSHKVKVLLQSCLVQHVVGVSTDRMDLARFKEVVFIQEPSTGVSIHRSLVNDSLAIILTMGFQIQLPETVGCREKLQRVIPCLANRSFHISILDCNGRIFDKARICKSHLARQVLKVVPEYCSNGIRNTAESF